MSKKLPSVERLREVLRYERSTGHLFWKVATSNRVRVGDRAGTHQANGYIKLYVDGVNLWAHRVCWAIAKGHWPIADIDHRNRITWDNRLRNLRDVSTSINMLNQREGDRKSQSTLLGAHYNKRTGKFMSRLHINGRTSTLGEFHDPVDAHNKHLEVKAQRLGGASGRRPNHQTTLVTVM
jgi:hypothetical protein